MGATGPHPGEHLTYADGYVLKDGRLNPTGRRERTVRTCARDMIAWLKAQLEPSGVEQQELGAAIARTHERHFLASNQCPQSHPIHFDMGLGWQIHPFKNTGLEIIEKNGGSFRSGQTSWVGFIKSKKLGVAVLANVIGQKPEPEGLGIQILEQRLRNSPEARSE
jgi:CubicO group peptidase (beta-lactamase class C family)